MVLQAALGHVLVDEQPVVLLAAVTDELHQVRMPELPQEDHLRLQQAKANRSIDQHAPIKLSLCRHRT